MAVHVPTLLHVRIGRALLPCTLSLARRQARPHDCRPALFACRTKTPFPGTHGVWHTRAPPATRCLSAAGSPSPGLMACACVFRRRVPCSIQPNSETREKQLEAWKSLVLAYAKLHRYCEWPGFSSMCTGTQGSSPLTGVRCSPTPPRTLRALRPVHPRVSCARVCGASAHTASAGAPRCRAVRCAARARACRRQR